MSTLTLPPQEAPKTRSEDDFQLFDIPTSSILALRDEYPKIFHDKRTPMEIASWEVALERPALSRQYLLTNIDPASRDLAYKDQLALLQEGEKVLDAPTLVAIFAAQLIPDPKRMFMRQVALRTCSTADGHRIFVANFDGMIVIDTWPDIATSNLSIAISK